MNHPVSVTFNGIYLVKLENEIEVPLKPKFYKRYVDDILSKGKLTRMT